MSHPVHTLSTLSTGCSLPAVHTLSICDSKSSLASGQPLWVCLELGLLDIRRLVCGKNGGPTHVIYLYILSCNMPEDVAEKRRQYIHTVWPSAVFLKGCGRLAWQFAGSGARKRRMPFAQSCRLVET